MAIRLAPVFVLACVMSALPGAAYAQTAGQILGFGADLSLHATPANPRPGDAVRIVAESFLLDLETFLVVWSEDDAAIKEGEGAAAVSVIAPALGDARTVTATVFEDGIPIIEKSLQITSANLGLLWESSSYVPPYFKGRALPSAGTLLYLEAMPRFTQDGAEVPREDLTYTWRRNDYVIPETSGRGRFRAVVEAPPLFGTDTISVEASTPDGIFHSAVSERIPAVEPRLVFYERHPLFGMMSHRAIAPQAFLSEDEISLALIPYYADAPHPGDDRLRYEWRVNDSEVAADPLLPNELTISAAGSSGIARIELVLTHAANIFLNVSRAWDVRLSSEDGFSEDPFLSTDPAP